MLAKPRSPKKASEVDNEKISAEEQLRESQRLVDQAADSLDEYDSLRSTLETPRDELRG